MALLNLSGSGDINQLGQIRGLETCAQQPLELLTAGDTLLTPEKDFFEAWKIYPWAVSSCLPLLCPVSVLVASSFKVTATVRRTIILKELSNKNNKIPFLFTTFLFSTVDISHSRHFLSWAVVALACIW